MIKKLSILIFAVIFLCLGCGQKMSTPNQTNMEDEQMLQNYNYSQSSSEDYDYPAETKVNEEYVSSNEEADGE
jgi:hypothetical protein